MLLCAHNLTLCTKLLSFCLLISTSTTSFFFTSNYIDKDDSAAVDIDSGSDTEFEASQQSQFRKTLHTKRKEKERKTKKSKSKSSRPLRDIANSPSSNTNMAPQSKAAAVAAERKKTKKAQQEMAAAEEEKQAAMAENARLKEQLAQQMAQLRAKSGRSSGTSAAPAPSKKRKEAPSSGSVAHKSQRSASNQGLSDRSKSDLTPLEAKMEAMLGAKRQYGGRRQNKDGVPDEMITRIHVAIKCGVFNDIKYVLGPNGKKKLVKAVLHKLKMEGYYGKGAKVRRNQAWFYELYADDVVAALNQVRSSTSTECKKAVKAYFDRNNGAVPSNEDYQRLLTRDLDLKNERDYALFEWYQMTLLPRACGSAANWNKAKREYHPLSTGAPKNSEKPYITPETEAYAVWLCKGNAIRWKKQFEIGEMPQYRGKIQRLLGPKQAKKKEVEVVELKEPEKDDGDDEGDDEEENGDNTGKVKGNSDDEEAGEEGEKVEADAVDEVSQSFLMFI